MKRLFLFLALSCFLFGSAFAVPDVNITGDFNHPNYIKGGTIHDISFAMHNRDRNATGFLVDAKWSLTCNSDSNIVIFDDLNLSTAFTHDTNDLNAGVPIAYDVNFYYSYTVPAYDFNACLILDFNNGTLIKRSDYNVMIDSTKAHTTWDGNSGWTTWDETITLTCTDNNSGCTTTYYRLDTDPNSGITFGALTPYTTAITVSAEGMWAITFYSLDRAGNQETSHAYSFNINKNPTANTTGLIQVDINHFSDTVNNSVKIAENTIGGVSDQGNLIGMAIGISLAIGLLLATALSIFYIVPTLLNRINKIK